MNRSNKLLVSIFIIWLFNISGIFGIVSIYSNWFLKLTPLNLALYFLLILWNTKALSIKCFLAFFIPMFIGFVTEFLGANYGLIFGSYDYGENLGYKLGGVPLMICVNWAVLTVITSDISQYFHQNILVKALIGAFLMTSLDVLIEVSAPRFDFWQFENNSVPIQNYVGWFVVSFFAHLLYQQFLVKTNRKLSWHIFSVITIFFLTFLIF